MPGDPVSVTVDAPAKINLTLEILNRRPDGYHNLRSIMTPVSLYDTIRVTRRAEGDEIFCHTVGEGVDVNCLKNLPQERHLAVRAARTLLETSGHREGLQINLTKRIPIGAGLGGGSADAAGTLLALNRLWNLNWSRERLAEIGSVIGCDVPAMVLGGAVFAEGTGTRVQRLLGEGERVRQPFWLVLIYPGIEVSTAKVFEKYESCLTAPPETMHSMRSFVRSGDVRGASRWLFNGLQKTIFELYPQAERFCLALREGGVLSSLPTGSGSAVFGLTENQQQAQQIRDTLGSDVWCRVLQTLPDGVTAAHGPLVP